MSDMTVRGNAEDTIELESEIRLVPTEEAALEADIADAERRGLFKPLPKIPTMWVTLVS